MELAAIPAAQLKRQKGPVAIPPGDQRAEDIVEKYWKADRVRLAQCVATHAALATTVQLRDAIQGGAKASP